MSETTRILAEVQNPGDRKIVVEIHNILAIAEDIERRRIKPKEDQWEDVPVVDVILGYGSLVRVENVTVDIVLDRIQDAQKRAYARVSR